MHKYARRLLLVLLLYSRCSQARGARMCRGTDRLAAVVLVYMYAYMLFYALSIYVYSFFYGYQPGSPFILFQRRRREPNEKLKRAEEKSRNKRADGGEGRAEGTRGERERRGGESAREGWRRRGGPGARGESRGRTKKEARRKGRAGCYCRSRGAGEERLAEVEEEYINL